jgi:hypothetical protein
VGEGGGAEPRGEAQPALAPRHVRVHHVHRRRGRAATAGGGARLVDEANWRKASPSGVSNFRLN